MVDKSSLCLGVVAVSVLSHAALAQDQGSLVSTNGSAVAILTVDQDSNAQAFYVDLGLSFRASSQSTLSFGIDAGVRGFNETVNFSGFSDSAQASTIYFEAVLAGRFGSVAVGQTRTATEMILKFPEFAGNPIDEYVARSYAVPFQETYLLEDGGKLGLRFDTELGGAKLSVSVNDNPNFGLAIQAAGSYEIGAFTLQAAVQHEESSQALSYLIGGQATFGKVDIGASYHENDFGFETPTVRAFGVVNWTDSLSTAAQVLYVTDGLQRISLDARKSWQSGTYVDLAVTGSNSSSSDLFGSATFGIKF